MPTKKECSKCEIEKELSEFYKCASTSDGLQYVCKSCATERKQSEAYKAKCKAHYAANREQIREHWNELYRTRYAITKKVDRDERRRLRKIEWMKDRQFCSGCKCNRLKIHFDTTGRRKSCNRCNGHSIRTRIRHAEQLRLKRKEKYAANRESVLAKNKTWRRNNPERLRASHRKYFSSNLNYRLSSRLRNTLNKILKRGCVRKNSKDRALELLGCSIDSLRIYIESKFEPGMTWDNWGIQGWHIDHIIPCAIFDLTKEDHKKRCFHFSNMQPLWAHDNLTKHTKYNSAEVQGAL